MSNKASKSRKMASCMGYCQVSYEGKTMNCLTDNAAAKSG